MKLLVRNLARTTTEQQIIDLFSEHGEVAACAIVMDEATKQSKGFAFVEMPKEGEANTAMAKLHHTNLDKSKIRVKLAS